MKTKKIPFYLLALFFTIGASLVAGLLSFGGMFALWPIIGLACASGVLAVLYEGEVFWTNIKQALNKLIFKPNSFKYAHSRKFLLDNFPTDTKRPAFFDDYEKQLKRLATFYGKNPDEDSKKQQAHIKKTLNDMEKWFSYVMFEQPEASINDDYTRQLHQWLQEQGLQHAKQKLSTSAKVDLGFILFSVVAGCFMALSTPSLIATLTTTALFTGVLFSPALIALASVVAGFGYGFLIYNAMSQMYENDTIKNWFLKIKNDFKNKRVFFPFFSVVLIVLALALTLCTAGTWWTIAAYPVTEAMRRLPGFVMGVANPVMMFVSSIFFSIYNICATLKVNKPYKEEIPKTNGAEDATAPASATEGCANATAEDPHAHLAEESGHPGNSVPHLSFWEKFKNTCRRENIGQLINPFRLLLTALLAPLKLVMFLAHLLSMSVDSDRVPHISKAITTGISFIMELFIDWHYFSFNHAHHHHAQKATPETPKLLQKRLNLSTAHNHDNDLPSRLLTVLLLPIYGLSTCWEMTAVGIGNYISKRRREGWRDVGYPDTREDSINQGGYTSTPITWKEAWLKQFGETMPSRVAVETKDNLSPEWRTAQTNFRLRKEYKKIGALDVLFTAPEDINDAVQKKVARRVAPTLSFFSDRQTTVEPGAGARAFSASR